MPKNRVVASFVGNFSPVNSRIASLVSSARHLRGDMGEELNRRAVKSQSRKAEGGRGFSC
jgi:hypothetical protein